MISPFVLRRLKSEVHLICLYKIEEIRVSRFDKKQQLLPNDGELQSEEDTAWRQDYKQYKDDCTSGDCQSSDRYAVIRALFLRTMSAVQPNCI